MNVVTGALRVKEFIEKPIEAALFFPGMLYLFFLQETQLLFKTKFLSNRNMTSSTIGKTTPQH